MPSFTSLLRNVFRKRQIEADLNDEVRAFVEMKTEENLARGMSQSDARRAALVECGGIEQVKESVREVRAGALLEQCGQDLHFGVRMLRKNPGFTAVAVLTIALGIGVNAGIFTIINAVAMHPLQVEDAARVVSVYQVFQGDKNRRVHGQSSFFSYPEYLEYRDHNEVFSGLVAYTPLVQASFSTTGRLLVGQLASCNYFEVLQAPVAMGRGFLPSECATGGTGAVVVLSDSTWKTEFGGDAAIIGKVVRVNRQPMQVIGVTAPGFTGTDLIAGSFWAPVTMQRAIEGGTARIAEQDLSWLVMMGRLKDGVTLGQARAQLGVIAARIDQQHPGRKTTLAVNTASLLDTPEAKRVVLGVGTVLLFAVGLVLLVVCANVANLMLARATGRRREFAVRLAVGASKGRLVRQLFTESLLLSTMGGALGLAVAVVSAKAAVLMVMERLPAGLPTLSLHVQPDLRVFAYTFALAVLTGLAFGLAPARQATRSDVNHDLKNGTAGSESEGGGKGYARHALVTAQVAFCTLLLIGAGLLGRGLLHAQTRDPGFRMDHVTVASLDLKAAAYSAERAATFQRRFQERLAGMPGIVNVARTGITQISGGRWSEEFATAGGGKHNLNFSAVSPEYFQLLDIPLVRGRTFTGAEASSGAQLAIVTESTARMLWPGEEPVGKHLVVEPTKNYEIVGVAKDTDTVHLGRSDEPYVYELLDANDELRANTLVRSSIDFATTAAEIRAAVRDVDPELAVQIAPLADNLEVLLAPSRIGLTFASLMGALGLAIAAFGIYGTVAYAVGRRTREIGIRMALGARGRDVVSMVLRSIMRPIVIGTAVGVAASLAVAQVLKILLFGVKPFDPLAYGVVVTFLMAVALLASYVPARRALKVDPMGAIRSE